MRYKGEAYKRKVIMILAAVILAAAIVTGVVLFLGRDKPVMVCGEDTLTNTEFSYFFWSEVNYMYSGENSGGPDLSKPLAEQMYDDTTTWEDHLLEQILPRMQEKVSMALAAKAEGFEMPDQHRQSYENVLADFEQIAEDMKYRNLTGYLKDTYGKGAKERTFREYLYNDFLADAYASVLFDRSEPTQEQVQAYYENWLPNYEQTGIEQAREDLKKENFYNAIAQAKASIQLEILYDNITVVTPHGAHIQGQAETVNLP